MNTPLKNKLSLSADMPGGILFLVLFLLSLVYTSPNYKQKGLTLPVVKNQDRPVRFTSDEQQNDKVRLLQAEVLAIHDEGMAYLDEMMRLRQQAEYKLRKLDNSNFHSRENIKSRQRLELAVKDLYEADEAMMSWMRQYRPLHKNKSAATLVAYLEEEKSKISLIKLKIFTSISTARRLL